MFWNILKQTSTVISNSSLVPLDVSLHILQHLLILRADFWET